MGYDGAFLFPADVARGVALSRRRGLSGVFPGWWIVLTGCFFNLWGAGYYVYGFSALFKPVASQFGFSRAVTSVASSIGRLGGGLLSPVLGWMIDRFGPRWVTLAGVSLFGAGLILMNFIGSLWSFYIVWGVLVATGFSIASMLPIDKAITNWFVKRRGLAMGIRWVFSGVLVLPLVTWLIGEYGWQAACVFGGIVMLVVGWALAWFFVKQHRPEYYGWLPDGAPADDSADAQEMVDQGVRYAAEFQEVEFTLRQALRTPAFWLLLLAQAGQGTALMSLMTHLIPLLTDMGVSPTAAATTMMLAGLASIASRFASGVVADRMGKSSLRFLMGSAYLLQAGGLVIFLTNPTVSMAYPFLILFYVGMGANMIMTTMIGGRYFGRKAFGSIRGTSAIASLPLGMAGPIFMGWAYDSTGTYDIALTVFAGVLALAALLMFLARPPRAPHTATDIHAII
jgi:MFS family permease